MCTWLWKSKAFRSSSKSWATPHLNIHRELCMELFASLWPCVFEVSSPWTKGLVPSFYLHILTLPVLESQLSFENMMPLRSKLTPDMELMILSLTAISCCFILIHCSFQFFCTEALTPFLNELVEKASFMILTSTSVLQHGRFCSQAGSSSSHMVFFHMQPYRPISFLAFFICLNEKLLSCHFYLVIASLSCSKVFFFIISLPLPQFRWGHTSSVIL